MDILKERWLWHGMWFYVITGLGTLSTHFGMYSYDMFISVYGVSTLDILWVQLIFAVWNVLNDLIGGYLSDWYNHRFNGRLLLIIPFNILWCISSVIPFYDIGIPYSLHYLLYICLNDGFFSVQAIVTSAFWVDDLTKNENERIKLSLITKPIGFVVGFIITWFSYFLFDKNKLDRFRMLYWISLLISTSCTILAYFALRNSLNKNKKPDTKNEPLINKEEKATFSMKIFFRDIIKQTNFWYFVIPSVINEFQAIFLRQFRPIFVSVFLNGYSDYFKSSYMSVLSAAGAIAEITILLLSFKVGCAYFIRLGIALRLLTSIIGGVIVLISTNMFEWNVYLSVFMMIFLFTYNISILFFMNFFNMIMSNLVMEQRAYRIKNNLLKLTSNTSMYWAIHACAAKPFNGVGTIIGTAVLQHIGYGGPNGEVDFDGFDDEKKQRLQYGLFHLIVWFMLITSFIQYVFFKRYNLENDNLKQIESIIHEHDSKAKYV